MSAYEKAASSEKAARRALLERLATDLAVIAEPYLYVWTCCWLSYEDQHGEQWLWQMCGGQMPGGLPIGPDGRHVTCGHWHHRMEVFLAG